MEEFFRDINNKDTLAIVLNNAIDLMVGNCNEEYSEELCSRLGIGTDPLDFVRNTKTIGQIYRTSCCNDATEEQVLAEFSELKAEHQPLVWCVLEARRNEILRFLLREHNSQNYPLVETFDWDLRYIMGDSSSPDNKRFIAVVTLFCREANGKPKNIQFQADEEKLDKLISELEKCKTFMTEQ